MRACVCVGVVQAVRLADQSRGTDQPISGGGQPIRYVRSPIGYRLTLSHTPALTYTCISSGRAHTHPHAPLRLLRPRKNGADSTRTPHCTYRYLYIAYTHYVYDAYIRRFFPAYTYLSHFTHSVWF